MFCYQCEQTAKGTGCTVQGVCGKDETTARLQDLLVYAAKGIGMYAHRARQAGRSAVEIDRFVIEALFTTVTNVDFDPERVKGFLMKAAEMRDRAKKLCGDSCEALGGPAAWVPEATIEGLAAQGAQIGIESRKAARGDDVVGLQELITYGLKGAAAYADHARILGQEDDGVYATFHEALDFLTKPDPTVDELTAWAFKVGEMNLKVMELLDAANTGGYGHPEPTAAHVTPIKGKALLVSGHDLKDLELILQQTEGKGVNVYTHGEMLPALAYPKLKAYKHLVGNYGTAWQNQRTEFDEFPGSIVMTTNCIQRPSESYKGRIFTTGLVAWPGVTHIEDKDFTPAIEAALAAPGFTEDAPEKTIMIGFGRNAVMSVAGTVIEAVKSGAIRHFFLVGGCDGAKPGRDYYTEFVEKTPKDTVVLTLACGKYRFNMLDHGDIGGIPRLLDIGQCNDAYSAIQIAVALAGAFECGVNDLPLSMILSWYEQKAVAILLTLLALGIKDIRLGPSLPAFVTPPVLNVLVEKFGIAPITTPDEDLAAILG
ncbi:MAG: hydroxylamine reductase [Armatimonadetes bacterium]|nr:hydroxylamine reductase [Armatimonadota bacterium]